MPAMVEENELEHYNSRVEEKRKDDFPQLKESCYLDHAGAALYSHPQIDAVFADLRENLFANPHSHSTSSRETKDRLDEARSLVANYFGVTQEDYAVVFTAGCTASLALTAASLNLVESDCASNSSQQRGAFIFLRESHTSVVGMRESFSRRGALIHCVCDVAKLSAEVAAVREKLEPGTAILCALPGQCNFSGYRYEPSMVATARQAGGPDTLVLLDAAALATCGEVDLHEWDQPDLVTVSFYKIFGYPTGLGALLVRRDTAGPRMQKDYFGGGTQDSYIPDEPFHRDRSELHERLEDGTVSYLAVASLRFGFEALNSYDDDNTWIARHVFSLVRYTRKAMAGLQHPNGAPVIVAYSRDPGDDWRRQGGTIAFNVLRADGSQVGYSQVGRLAALYDIQLRTGCFCNVGACQLHLDLGSTELTEQLAAGHVCGDTRDIVDGRPTGAVRVSFGYSSTLDDAKRLIEMLSECFVVQPISDSPVPASDNPVALRRICVFPVKSCRAFCPTEWPLSPTGLLYDREWLIVDRRNVAITLTQCQRLYRIRPRIELDAGDLVLTAEGHKDLRLPLTRNEESNRHASTARVCTTILGMSDCGDPAAKWLEAVLEISDCRLLRQHQERESPLHAGPLSLNNLSHVLLINLSTVQQLRSQLPNELEEEELLQRFRANLLVDGLPALREDMLSCVQIGDELFKAVAPCQRCRIICVDSNLEQKTQEPMKTIMQTKSKLTFGTYFMRCDNDNGEIGLNQKLIVSFKH